MAGCYVNTSLAKAGDFALRLETGLVNHPNDWKFIPSPHVWGEGLGEGQNRMAPPRGASLIPTFSPTEEKELDKKARNLRFSVYSTLEVQTNMEQV